MNDGKHGANHKSKYCDNLGAARDWPPPGSIGETQNRRYQRSRMANSDPEHKIRNVESPEYRPIKSGDANAGINLIYPRLKSGGDTYPQGCYG